MLPRPLLILHLFRVLCESKEEDEKQETSNLETPPNEDNQKPNDEQVQVEAEVREEITDETKDAVAAAAVQAVSEEVPEKKEDDIYENPLLVDVSTMNYLA